MVEGRTYKPVIDPAVCRTCGVCVTGCPAEWITEYRDETDSLRGAVYGGWRDRARRDEPAVPPCQTACPVGLETARYTASIAKGRFREALDVIGKVLPFPRTMGLICHHPCEEACVRGRCVDKPVSLCALKAFVAGIADVTPGRGALPRVCKTGKKAAVVGAGPAGLTCAHDLALSGHDVTVYEALPEPGGMLRYAIPEYRLPKWELAGEIDCILKLGIDMRCGVEVGKDITLHEIAASHDAVFIGTGAPAGIALGIEGEDLPGVMDGIRFLRAVESGEPRAIGRRAAVIGGGNTAVDCARTAGRLAGDVTLVYRRTKDEMPAVREEIEALTSEGIKLQFLAAPARFIGKEKLTEIECIRMEQGEPDSTGRRRPMPIEGSEFRLPVDTVITALGQRPETSFANSLPIPVAWDGAIKIDPKTGAAGLPGVFAGGDVVTGPAYAIDAIAAGKRAAASMDRYLRGREVGAKNGET